MKRRIFSLGLMLAATFTLTNCVKEVNQPVDVPSAGIPFEIVASASEDTKTENDGIKTKWTADDAINLFHSVTGLEEYVSDNSFTITEENLAQGRFKGELGEALDGSKSYDWYAFYPYSSYITTPANTAGGYSYIGHSGGLKQNAYDSMESLCDNVCPLYGIAKNVPASELPSVKMNHLASVVRIRVTNASGSPMTVDNASFTAPEDIVGQYYIGFSTDQPVFTAKSVKNTATVEVTNATELANGGVADLYLAVKPFTAKTGEEIVITVNGYSKTIKMTKDVTFTAGKIKTVNFSFTAKTATFDFTKPSLYGIEPSKEASKGVKIPASITVGDVTMTAGSNSESKVIIFTKSDGATYEMRAYNTDMLSFSVPEGYVVKSMTFTGKAADSSIDPEIGLYGSKVWTGSANPLNLNLLATINVETITVVYDLGVSDAPKTPQEVSFPQETYEITFGDDFTAPALSGAQTAVTYSTSNKDVATVDESGNVTVTGAGTATITAVAEADGTYRSAKASYKLIVNPAASEEVMTLPWNEDFSGDNPLANYTIVNGDSDTKLYEATNAGGEAPEILIGKNGGSLTAKIDSKDYKGQLTLVFKSNYPGYLDVTSSTEGVTVAKNSDTEYVITLENAGKFDIILTNNKGSNTRVDDISLTKGATQPQTLSFSGTSYTFTIGKDVPANFEEPELTGAYTTVTYSSSNTDVATVDAETGAVILGSTAGTAEITATAAAENGYKEASASYTITLIPAGLQETGYTLTFDDKSKRTEFSTDQQVWEENGIIFTNNKGSGSDVGNYENPVRLYKNSEIVITLNGSKTISKIVFECNTSSYATALASSIGGSATISGKEVTLIFDDPQESCSITLSDGQVRLNSLTVYTYDN